MCLEDTHTQEETSQFYQSLVAPAFAPSRSDLPEGLVSLPSIHINKCSSSKCISNPFLSDTHRHTPYGRTAGLSHALSKIGLVGIYLEGERVREASLSHNSLSPAVLTGGKNETQKPEHRRV